MARARARLDTAEIAGAPLVQQSSSHTSGSTAERELLLSSVPVPVHSYLNYCLNERREKREQIQNTVAMLNDIKVFQHKLFVAMDIDRASRQNQ